MPWHLQQITTSVTGGPAAPGEYIATNGPPPEAFLFVSVYQDQQHFAYLSINGSIQDAWYNPEGWHLQQINNPNNAGPVVPGEYVATQGPSCGGTIFVSVYDDQQHFAYLNVDGSIQDAWYGPDGWHLQQINNPNNTGPAVPGEYIATDGPSFASNLLFVSVYNDQHHFTYLAHDGSIQDAWYNPNGWHLRQINNPNNGQPAVLGESIVTDGPPWAPDSPELFVSIYNDQHHFTYLGPNGSIQDAWYDRYGWHLQQINNPNNAGPVVPGEYVATDGPAAASHLFVSVYKDQHHFAYIAGGGSIQDAWYGPDGWHLRQINNPNNGQPAVPGESIVTDGPAPGPGAHGLGEADLFISVYEDQQHFAYIANGSIQDAWYDRYGWHLQQINNPNNAGPVVPGEYVATNDPFALSGLFVSIYNNQQHFAYITLDNDSVQDGWYG